MGNFTNVQNFYFLIPLAIAPIICYNNLTKTLKSVSQYKGYSYDFGGNKEISARRQFLARFEKHTRHGVSGFESARKIGGGRRGRDVRQNRERNEHCGVRGCVRAGRDFRPRILV